MNWFPWFLFAHVLGAVIAFGPTFSLPILGRMGGAEKQHGNFATRVSLAISKQRIIPLAILQGITGVGLIITGNVDMGRAMWLNIAIVLYLIALGFALFVQTPTAQAIVKLTSGPPPAPGALPSEPSPVLFPLIRRSQLGGMFLAGLIVVIVFLMVVKPQF
ncbi:MAG TPA: DUF2269 family protein [Candidatus Limnocylindrales bacterium]|nr:DUF2269 family protein [Candidatus Limnocylindrales bacterium]